MGGKSLKPKHDIEGNRYGKLIAHKFIPHVAESGTRGMWSVGYVLSNCVPCCAICNSMKSSLESNLFLSHIAKIYLYSLG